MRPLPQDNRRPMLLLTTLAAITVAVVSLVATYWIQHRSEDRGYMTEIRGALRKYGEVAAVPRASRVWLGRVHDRSLDQVQVDLAKAATDPSAFDPEAQLHEDPSFFVQLYLSLGFVGLWLTLCAVGLLVALPVVSLVIRGAQPPPRREPDLAQGW